MSSTLVTVGPRLGIAMLALTCAAAAAAAIGHLGQERRIVVAVARAVVQLALVSAVIAAIVHSIGFTLLFVAVMCAVASRTSARRMTRNRSGWWAAVPILSGSLPVAAGLLLSGLVPLRGIALIPVTGILIGGAMTATSLAGRRALDELSARRGEVEAALSLGFSDRDAALEMSRPTAAQALVPALDQTRTVGLVTLPGAFVGMLLGGASPIDAGAVQLFVLVSLLAVETIAVVLVLELVARGLIRR
ncbi:MAG TPA: ABC transporter permease [Actinomycetales bacterium]|nr:ABC transporter permease [Actinomycetales bacterium]